MPYSRANGIKIYYEVSGKGFPFVLVHANPFDHNLWMYQISHFSTYFKIIAVDIRGYGRSDKPTSEFSLKEMAEDVLGVCRDEGVKEAIHKILPQTGHACCIEDPAGFDALVVEFLNSQGLMSPST